MPVTTYPTASTTANAAKLSSAWGNSGIPGSSPEEATDLVVMVLLLVVEMGFADTHLDWLALSVNGPTCAWRGWVSLVG